MPEPTAAEEIMIPANPDESKPRLWPMATVMAAGVFATTFVQLQGLGQLPFNHLLTKMGLSSDKVQAFVTVATIPWSFKFIAGLLVDGVPLFGSRRRAYLLLSGLTASACWALMAFSSSHYGTLLTLAFAMNVMIVFGSTTSGGLLVEAGQRFGASGRLSSLRVFAQNLGAAFGLPVGGFLADKFLGWTCAAAVIPLSCMFLTAWILLKDPPLPPQTGPRKPFFQKAEEVASSIWSQIKNVWRIEMLVPAILVCFIQGVPTFRSACFYQYQTGPLHYTDANLGWLGFIGYGVALLSSGVYAWGCRKLPLRVSLYAAIILTSLSALPYLFYAPYAPYMLRASTIEGVGTFLQYLAYLPLFDLVVRCTPKGSEALGYSVLIGVWNLGLITGTQLGSTVYEHLLHKNMASLIWLNAGVTMAGIFLVFLLPRALVNKSEG